MSIKTLRKKIALVAVAALSFGLVSSVSSNAAGGAGNITVYGASSTGVCSVTDVNGDLVSLGATDTLYSTLSAPYAVTVAVGGVVSIQVNQDYWTYTAGGQTTINTAGTLHSSFGLWDATGQASQTITANSAGTTVIKSYTADPFTAANTVGTTAAATTPVGSLSVTVVAACAGNTYSTTYSGINVAAAYDTTPQFTDGDVLTYAAGSAAYINIDAFNAYNAALPASTSWAASATNGAFVKFGTDATIDDAVTTKGANSFASTTTDGDSTTVRVDAPSVAGGTTTVTVSVDGGVIATKTITFLPEATKIEIVKALTGVVGGEGAFLFQLKAANGAVVPGSVAVRSTTLTNRVSAVTAIKAATITASDLSPNNNETINAVDSATVIGGSASATSAFGLSKFTCATGGSTGSTTVTLRHTTPVNGAYVDLDVELKCAGGINTYTVSMDKAAYKVGEIATLTITAKDSTGAAVSDFTALGANQAVSAGGATVVKAAADADTFSGGTRTVQFQMTTAGSFNAVANLPASTTTKSATAAYTVSDGAVTNAEVLASIVKLIASINKQIRNLQKLIRR